MFHRGENVAGDQHPNFHFPPPGSGWVAVPQLSIGEMGRMSPPGSCCHREGESGVTDSAAQSLLKLSSTEIQERWMAKGDEMPAHLN